MRRAVQDRVDQLASHLPYLLAAVAQTTGNVLELGGGVASTPALHKALLGTGRVLVTIERALTWRERLKMYAEPWHLIVADGVSLAPLIQWGAVLVDSDPGSERPEIVRSLRGADAQLVVVHDTEDENARAYGWGDSLDGWEHRWDSPPGARGVRTTVLSNLRAFEWPAP